MDATPRKIRLLYVLSEFMFGSKVRQLSDLVTGLNKALFDIEICGVDVGDEAMEQVERLGVPCLHIRLHPPRKFELPSVAEFATSPYKIMSGNYDLIHSLCYQSLLIEPLIVKLFSRAKFVYTKTNLEWENHRMNWHLKSRLADRIISISRATDDLITAKGFARKMETIPLGVDTGFFGANANSKLRQSIDIPYSAFVFGCAAQLVEWKEHITLIKAFETLCASYNDIYLVLCGPNHDDAYYRSVMSTISDSRFANRIRFLGTIDDMPSFYSAVDCFVLPSRYEPFGYVYVEAMSCCKPVIACRAGGPLDIVVEGETGFFVEISNYEDLAAKMGKYISRNELIVTHGRAARERVERLFSKEVMVQRHENLYLALLDGKETRD